MHIEKTKTILRELHLWMLFISYCVLCVLTGIRSNTSDEGTTSWTVLIFALLLLLGIIIFFLFLLARLTPRTSRYELFPLTTLPDVFWRVSYSVGIVLILYFARTLTI